MAHSTRSYGIDLRERVVQARLSGKSVSEVCALYSVDDNSVYRWVKKYQETGGYGSSQRGGHKRPKIQDTAKFEAFVKANAHATLKQMQAAWDQEVSLMSLSRMLKKLGITRKKNTSATASATKESA